MFWKSKEKRKDSQPNKLRRPPPTNPLPRPPVVYAPPPPPSEMPEEQLSAAPKLENEQSQAESPLPPTAEEVAVMRQRGAMMVVNGDIDAGVGLLLDVLQFLPDDFETLWWIDMAISPAGKFHITPKNMERIQQLKPPQIIKPQIIDR
jgi:hypothetical protein